MSLVFLENSEGHSQFIAQRFYLFFSPNNLLHTTQVLLTDLPANSFKKVLSSSPPRKKLFPNWSQCILLFLLTLLFYPTPRSSFILHYKGLNYYPAGNEVAEASQQVREEQEETGKVKLGSFFSGRRKGQVCKVLCQ